MIKTLLVDDETPLLDLAEEFLGRGGELEIETASSCEEAMVKLESGSFDIIISDYQMPGNNGIEFLKILRSRGDDIPFILFTGRGREEVVIEALASGADQYVMKGGDPMSQFAHLRSTIDQIMFRRKAEEALRHNARRFRSLIENSSDLIGVFEEDGIISYVSPSVERILGRLPSEMIGHDIHDLVHPEDAQIIEMGMRRLLEGRDAPVHMPIRISAAGGVHRLVEMICTSNVTEGGRREIILNARDVTEQGEAKERIEHLNRVLVDITAVNQLIVKEKNKDRLLRKVCESLVSNQGYLTAWIALFDEERFQRMYHSGREGELCQLSDLFKFDGKPSCIQRILRERSLLAMREGECGECPLLDRNDGYGAFIVPLSHGSSFYGALVLSIRSKHMEDSMERQLAIEIADDIAFALYSLELESERCHAEQELKKYSYYLQERVKEMNCLYRVARMGTSLEAPIEEMLESSAIALSSAFQYPGVTSVRIRYRDSSFQTEGFCETAWCHSAEIIVGDYVAGDVQVCYLDEVPKADDGPFLTEERVLVETVAHMLGRMIHTRELLEDIGR